MLLPETSSLFINLPADRIDSSIEDAQRRICLLLDLDRSTLWKVAELQTGTLVAVNCASLRPTDLQLPQPIQQLPRN